MVHALEVMGRRTMLLLERQVILRERMVVAPRAERRLLVQRWYSDGTGSNSHYYPFTLCIHHLYMTSIYMW